MSIVKTALLGENFSTANAKLRKLILFSLVQKLGLDVCYRCNKKIETIETLSIEHITAWQQAENPVESFYDIENISFSHLACNISAALKPNKIYSSPKEYRAANWKKHYAKNSEEVLKRKKERYQLGVAQK